MKQRQKKRLLCTRLRTQLADPAYQFSRGHLDRQEAMERLGMRAYAALLQRRAKAGLPFPSQLEE